MIQAVGISDTVRTFVTDQITSVEQLEVLLFLRSNPARGWTVAELTRELRSSSLSVTSRLRDLRDRGFLRTIEGASEATFVYSPKTPKLADAVTELAATYAERPHVIIRMIFTTPREP